METKCDSATVWLVSALCYHVRCHGLQIGQNQSRDPPYPSIEQKQQNSNNDSFGIHSVKVLVQVHYFYFEHGCPFGVPICPKGIEGPKEPAKKKNITKWNLEMGVPILQVESHPHNLPKIAIMLAQINRLHLFTPAFIMGTPTGYPYAPRRGALQEPGTSRRRVDVRLVKRNNVHPVGAHMGHPQGAPLS